MSADFGNFQSANGRKWQLPNFERLQIEEFIRNGANELEARILINRGASPHEFQNIINPRLKTQMPDPYSILGMENAVLQLIGAVENGKKILIFADYDVDGATSCAIFMQWFKSIDYAPQIFIPDRMRDGYGPSPKLMRAIKETGCDLLITLDCGAAAYDALEEAHSIGLDVIVFDHHLMDKDAPHALALVNPNQFGDNSGLGNLTAAGVAFMAIVALNREWRGRGGKNDFDPIQTLDLAALGTVCDVAPLIGLNRVIVAQGQRLLKAQNRLGLKILGDIAGLKKPGNVHAMGFVLGPRLNAGGRIGDSSLATKLLISNDEQQAFELGQTLEALNGERRAIELDTINDAMAQYNAMPQEMRDLPFIVLANDEWHPGIIGIVAGRIKDRLNRPTIILGANMKGDVILKGSGRSINGVNLGGLIKSAVNAGIIEKGGGHEMAAGLSIDKTRIDDLRTFLAQSLENEIGEILDNQAEIIDAIIALKAINIEIVATIERLSPFGQAWSEPKFLLQNVYIKQSNRLNGGHLRVLISDGETNLNAISFNSADTALGEILQSKAQCNLLVKIRRDDWKGNNTVAIEIIDGVFGDNDN